MVYVYNIPVRKFPYTQELWQTFNIVYQYKKTSNGNFSLSVVNWHDYQSKVLVKSYVLKTYCGTLATEA